MNFLVDAQLPRRMTAWLAAAGCNAIHTLDLPDANRTTDEQINDVADREQRVVVTKTPTSWTHTSFGGARRSCC
jgi:predicted nuclease of predicted toxin-antitoxin system